MKKILKYVLIFIFIIIVLPNLCTKKRKKQNVQTSETTEEEKQEIEKYDYSKYKTIKLYHAKTSQIEELSLDDYLYGVVSSEMPASFEKEALKAQAIVARTYTIYQITKSKGKHGDADICDDYKCCQAWISKEDRLAKWSENEAEANWNKIVEAVDSTQGKIITYNGSPIDAFFHSNSGGTTETASNVWGGDNFPYLQSVQTSGEDGYTQYSSEVEFSQSEFIDKIKTKHPDFEIDFNDNSCVQILEYTESGRIRTIKFGNIQIAGTEARTLLGLKSTNFSFEIVDGKIKFKVLGYGHGVGMSQTGADSMAKAGGSAEEIIKHFYSGVEISFVNDL